MTCYCGHVEDEHDKNGGACVIETCPCGFFEAHEPSTSVEGARAMLRAAITAWEELKA